MASTSTSDTDQAKIWHDELERACQELPTLSHRGQLSFFQKNILPIVEKDLQQEDRWPHLATLEEIIPACRKALKENDEERIRQLVHLAATSSQMAVRQALHGTSDIQFHVREQGDRFLISGALTKGQFQRLKRARWISIVLE